jgi:hypothetical protein
MKRFYFFLITLFILSTEVFTQPVTGDYSITNFEDLTIETDTFWNGADESGSFISGNMFFKNNYNSDWAVWNGFAYSNMGDDTTGDYTNQYSAITGQGYDTAESQGSNYTVSYVSGFSVAGFSDSLSHELAGFYLTNSTYTALSMKNGDPFSKKFGGDSGNDPDWFKLTIKAMYNGSVIDDSVDFYLADYRFTDNSKDYIITDWEWVDLSSLGKTDSILFILSSSDVGIYGMNTPAYFCADNFYVKNESNNISEIALKNNFNIYPNPSRGIIKIKTNNRVSVLISSINGSEMYKNSNYNNNELIDISFLPAGIYFVNIYSEGISETKRIIIQ